MGKSLVGEICNASVGGGLGEKFCPVKIFGYMVYSLSDKICIDRISAAAASTLEELKTQTRAGLEHSISQRNVCVLLYTHVQYSL